MLRNKRYIVVFWLLAFSYTLYCQYYLTGEDPARIKWLQLKTPNFKLVFPESYIDNAQETANKIELAYSRFKDSSVFRKKRIPVIIHNQSILSNGFVVWAPRRSEFFTIPPQDNMAMDWIEQLSLHEMKHIAQIESLDKGLTHLSSYIFGEQAIGAVAGLVPRWYFEGDAVYYETEYSFAGRGRMPSFEKNIKALNLESKKRLSYDQAIFGSYKHFVPNHYEYGYQLVKFGNEKFGNQLWDNILNGVGKNPFTVIPFYFQLKNETGLTREELYNNTFDYYDSIWINNSSSLNLSTNRVTPINKHYTSYRYPQFINDSTIIALKTGIDDTKLFVKIDLNGKEEKLIRPGFYTGDKFSYNKGIIAWTETVFDYRWDHRTYTCIKTYNLRTNKKQLFLKKGRYFSPAISPDGNKLAVIEANKDNLFILYVYNFKNASQLHEFSFLKNEIVQTPYWINNSEIAVVIANNKGKRIEVININSNHSKIIQNTGYNNISNPVAINNYIAFNTDFGETNAIYFIDTLKSENYKLENNGYGIFNPSINTNDSTLIFTQYHSLGYAINKIKFNDTLLHKTTIHKPEKIQPNNHIIDFNSSNNKKFLIEKYNRFENLINIHSWFPAYLNINDIINSSHFIDIIPGITLLSQNELGNAIGYIGVGYENHGGLLQSGFTYRRFYPVIEGNISIGQNQISYFKPADETHTRLNWEISGYIPVNFSKNRWYRTFKPQITFNYQNDRIYNKENQWDIGFSSIQYQVDINQRIISSYRDLLPRIGHVTSIRFNQPIKGKKYAGNIFKILNTAYLPGIFKHHHIKVSVEYQRLFPFTNSNTYNDGYIGTLYNEYVSLKNNYSLPLLYPDYNFAWLFYIKRIKLNIFYNYLITNEININNSAQIIQRRRQYGIDIINDMHLFRIIVPFECGLRFYFSNQPNLSKAELIFNINLDSLY